jgi:AraC family transcriptional regulator
MRESRSIYKARVDAAIMYMHDHLQEKLVLEDLASNAGFSPFHFHRIFSALIGETPQQFLNRMRLERAANMLVKYSGYSITQIAMNCGFSSSSAFARSFKNHFGTSANEYRKAEIKPVPEEVQSANIYLKEPSQIRVEIRSVPLWNLIYVSILKGYKIELICKGWDQLIRWATAHGLFTKETRVLGISFDDPLITPPDKCRYYACLSIDKKIIPQPPIGFMQLAGSKCMVVHVTCLLEEIQAVYMYLYRDWLLDSGFQPADLPPYEIYLATPETNPEGKYELEVHIPIVPL